MAQIMVKANVVVPNGPQFAFNQTLDVDAYDKIDVTVPADPNSKKVELQPGAAGQVQFIAIVSDWYGDDLSFKINVGTAANTDVFTLDRPLLFMGGGAVALFDPAPKLLFFNNGTSGATAKDANIQILIGRDATP